MTTRIEVIETLEDARDYRRAGIEQGKLSILQTAMASYKFVTENINLLAAGDPSPAEIYLEAGLLRNDAVGILMKAGVDNFDTSLAEKYLGQGKELLRHSIMFKKGNFYARVALYHFVHLKALLSSGLSSALQRMEREDEKHDMIAAFTEVKSVGNFIEWSGYLFQITELKNIDLAHRRDFLKVIATINVDNLRHGKDQLESEKLFSEARRLQRRAKVELNA